MGFIRYGADLNVLVVTKGHPFERDAFFAVFESWRDIAHTAVEQPAAQAFFTPEAARAWDAFVLYDMPGIGFRPGRDPEPHEPPPQLVRGFAELLDEGKGFVFLHHAIAGWPTWDAYADAMGGRFLYAPATLRGRKCPDSGYRHAVKHRLRVVEPAHPVVQGLGEGFEIEDEVYLLEVFEADVLPLLRSDHEFVDANFYSSALAVRGEMFSREGWSHAPGSDLVAWARRAGRSPVVTITCGDGPTAYANEGFRRLLENAVRWVASQEARDWAASAKA
ncbi:MAG: ThuA domain-containing protein [Myxococcota bacterium]|nr:ThuA domain-containing protein [Myxococcota bacterium]